MIIVANLQLIDSNCYVINSKACYVCTYVIIISIFRYTSRATLELDGIGGAITTSNTSTVVATSSVDKSITFPQLHQHSDGPALQLEGDYNSVRCIVESTSGNSATAASLVGAAGETQPPRQQMTPSLSQGGPTSTLVPAQYRLLSVANPKLIHGVDRFQHHSDKVSLIFR